jgi:cytochrome bd ubiquinol oxidase subunit II
VFAFHGAVFVALKTEGEVRARAKGLTLPLGGTAVLFGAVFLIWTQLAHGTGWTWTPVTVAAVALMAAVTAAHTGREGWAFTGTALTIIATTVALFGALYPDVLPASNDAANSLTTTNASSTPYTLEIMTWVAVFFTPVVLAYQAWTYWVFRNRVSRAHIPASQGLVAERS